MTFARSQTVDPTREGTYHCWSRCVRRAYLCGFDTLTGQDFYHRKKWVENRLRELSQIFAISVLAYALMDNHKHLMLRNLPQLVATWSDEEIARRWWQLFPRRRGKDGRAKEPNEDEIAEITKNPERIRVLRLRLADISWFMRCINEYIARRANREDEVTGRFWEGRFKSKRLDDNAAVLSCMVYVDLNPIRAKKAATPEQSEFTSAYARIVAENLKTSHSANKGSPADWLCPIESVLSPDSGLSLQQYLSILDATGRALAEGKWGSIDPKIRPILERISINPDDWLNTTTQFGRRFPRIAGSVEKMREAAATAGKKWFKGISAAAIAFRNCQARAF